MEKIITLSSKYGVYFVFVAALLWASDAPFRVHLTQDLSPTFIVLAQHFIGLLIVSPFLWIYRKEIFALSLKQWGAVVVIGVGGSALALLLFTMAFSHMPQNPSTIILLQKLQPLIAIFLAMMILKEKPGKNFWVFTTIALVGAYIVSFPKFTPQLFVGEELDPSVMGVFLAIGAAFLWASSTVMGRYMLADLNFKSLVALRFLLGFVFLLVVTSVTGAIGEVQYLDGQDFFYLFVISVITGVGALFLYYLGLKHTRASVATLAELGFPVGAVVVNYFFLNESLSLSQVVGIGIVLFALTRLTRIGASKD